MTPLRKHMIEAIQVRGSSLRTHESYLAAGCCKETRSLGHPTVAFVAVDPFRQAGLIYDRPRPRCGRSSVSDGRRAA